MMESTPAKRSFVMMESTPAKRLKTMIVSLVEGQQEDAVTGLASMRSEIRNYQNAKGSGQVFSFVLSDETGDIRVSVFGKNIKETWQLCDTDRVVRISGGMLKVANAKYNTTNNELELTMSIDGKGSVHQSLEQVQRRPVAYAFKKIANIRFQGLNSCVDVIGAVATMEPPKLVTTREGKEISRSKVSLVDDSGFSVSCTFWGSATGQVASMSEGDVLAIKSAKIQEYAGSICLGCSASKLTLNPDDADARGIHEWYALARTESTQFRPLVSGRGLRGDCPTSGDGAFVMEFPAHMQTSFDQLRKIRIRCGNKQYVGILTVLAECGDDEGHEVPPDSQLSFSSRRDDTNSSAVAPSFMSQDL